MYNLMTKTYVCAHNLLYTLPQFYRIMSLNVASMNIVHNIYSILQKNVYQE